MKRFARNPGFGGAGGGAGGFGGEENFVVGMENRKQPAKAAQQQFKRGDFVVDGNTQKPKAQSMSKALIAAYSRAK